MEDFIVQVDYKNEKYLAWFKNKDDPAYIEFYNILTEVILDIEYLDSLENPEEPKQETKEIIFRDFLDKYMVKVDINDDILNHTAQIYLN